jgi:hypothetical protein
VDRTARYQSVLRQYPEIAVSEPLWQAHSAGDWSQVVPLREDVALLANVVKHCDAVINLGSTMAMDFAVFDKPGLFLAYNPAVPRDNWNVLDLYQLPHFQTVHELQPVYWVRSANELQAQVIHALRVPQEKSAARQAWLRRHAEHPLDQASERCAQALEQLRARTQNARDRKKTSPLLAPAAVRMEIHCRPTPARDA